MKKRTKPLWAVLFFLFCWGHVYSQTTEFTYQGNLTVGGTPANGSFDFTFTLFDASLGGSPVVLGILAENIPVTDGVFSAKLNFGNVFPGQNRFLEIQVRPSGSGTFTTLAPRQPITSSPYAVKSRNADNATTLNSQPATFYTNASNLSSGTVPVARLGNGAILNQTTPQASGNFNISGNGTAGGTLTGNIVDAGQHFSIGGQRILSGDGNNTFAGFTAGSANTGTANSFFGVGAGSSNTTGLANSFYGTGAGQDNVNGSDNSFLGVNTGKGNTSGNRNTFIGRLAGRFNTTGNDNTFVGYNAGAANGAAEFNTAFGSQAGQNNIGTQNSFFGGNAGMANVGGFGNSFFGRFAGIANTEGDENSFFGRGAGQTSTLGNRNTMLGANADVGSNNLTNATAIGARALVTQSNSIVLGSINGVNTATADTRVGIGTTAPSAKLAVAGNGAFNVSSAARFDLFNTTANAGFLQFVDDEGDWQLATTAGSTAIEVLVHRDTGQPNVTRIYTTLFLETVGTGGSSSVCRNPTTGVIGLCASSARYQTNTRSFGLGLPLLNRLRPVSFDWKDEGTHDIGLIAEEVAEVEPLLVTHNEKGEVEGVKYDRLGVVVVNAVKEQQAQIDSQGNSINALRDQVSTYAATIKHQQAQIAALTKLICGSNQQAEICKENR